MFDHIPEIQPGEEITAEWLAMVALRLNRQTEGEDFHDDELGSIALAHRKPAGFRRFEMTAALSLGGSASALIMGWRGGVYSEDAAETSFLVYDWQQRFSKPVTTSGAEGAFGVAQYWADRGVWEILSMDLPMHFKATAKGAVLTTDGTYTVDNFVPYYGCYSHVVDATEEVTAQNTFSDAIDDNGVVTLSWNGTDEQFETDDVECPS